MKRFPYIIITASFLLLAVCLPLVAQTDYHATVVIPSLAPGEMGAMLIDRQGLLWIGTSDGLLSYDGYALHEHLTGKAQRRLMKSSHVISLAEDNNRRLWIGTYDGLLRMDLATGAVRRYELPRKSQQIIYTLFAAKDGTLYAGTDDGLSVYDAAGDTFTNYNDRNTVAIYPDGKRRKTWGYSVKSIAELPDGDLLVGTWSSGMLRYNPRRRAFRAYGQLNGMNSAFAVATDLQGRVWIGTWNDGIQRMDNANDYALTTLRTMAPRTADFGSVYALKVHPDGKSVWACTDGGVRVIDGNGVADLSQIDGRRLKPARRMAATDNGLFLVATQTGQVLSIKPWQTNFKFFTAPGIYNVYSIYTGDGRRLLLGNGTQGVASLDMATGAALYNNGIPGMAAFGDDGRGARVQDIIRRRNGDIWMAAGDQQIIIAHKDGRSEQTGRDKWPCLVDNVCQLYDAPDGSLWVGMRKGVSVIGRDGKGRHLDIKTRSLDMTGYWLANHLMMDDSGCMWASSKNDGIVRLGKGRYRHYPAPTNVTACYEDSHGRLWAVSPTDGLLRYNRRTDSFKAMTDSLHLGGRKICAINEDANGSLWLATDGALVRLTLDNDEKATTTIFTTEDGLPSATFLPNSTFRYHNLLFFGTTDGVVGFAPEKLLGQESPPAFPLAVTGLSLDGVPFASLDSATARRISPLEPAYTHSLRIPASVRKLAVDFSLLNYSNTAATQYAYRLEGYDDWQYLPANVHSASFDRLPSGHYKLHLKAADSHGQWSEMPYTIDVRVLPPWYRTWWAYIIYILLLCIFGRLTYNYLRMRRETMASRRFSAMMRSMEPTVTKADKTVGAQSGTPSKEETFLKRANALVKEHLDDADYNRDRLASDLGVGLTQLYQRLRQITGLSVQAYIQNLRLNAAADILRAEPDIRISELAYRVGFNTPKYFSQCFKKEFGMLPGEFVRQL